MEKFEGISMLVLNEKRVKRVKSRMKERIEALVSRRISDCTIEQK